MSDVETTADDVQVTSQTLAVDDDGNTLALSPSDGSHINPYLAKAPAEAAAVGEMVMHAVDTSQVDDQAGAADTKHDAVGDHVIESSKQPGATDKAEDLKVSRDAKDVENKPNVVDVAAAKGELVDEERKASGDDKEEKSSEKTTVAVEDVKVVLPVKEDSHRVAKPVQIPEKLSLDIAKARAKFAQAAAASSSDVTSEERDKVKEEVPRGIVSKRISEMATADIDDAEEEIAKVETSFVWLAFSCFDIAPLLSSVYLGRKLRFHVNFHLEHSKLLHALLVS